MDNEFRWFACLCVIHRILNERGCRLILNTFQPEERMDVVTFAEKLYKTGICEDQEFLQDLVNMAGYLAYQKSPTPFDPFRVRGKDTPFPARTGGDTPMLFAGTPPFPAG